MMAYYVPVMTRGIDRNEHNPVVGGIYTSEKLAIYALIEIILANDLVWNGDEPYSFKGRDEMSDIAMSIAREITSLDSLVEFCYENGYCFADGWDIKILRLGVDEQTNLERHVDEGYITRKLCNIYDQRALAS